MHLDKPEIVLWNSGLKALTEGQFPFDANLLFYKLMEYDIVPGLFHLFFLCAALSGALNGKIVHGHVEKLGFRSNLFLQNMIVHLYASCGTMGDARLSFDKMSQRSFDKMSQRS
ncbi:pentatricopeptide repeat-containing protein [Quercus suber]|uniref:Pentatricopeptide repeat-containing protein n=1 Tax=Quercus suber TaxID=58331 RepID=A0AAW0KTT6_QUESU